MRKLYQNPRFVNFRNMAILCQGSINYYCSGNGEENGTCRYDKEHRPNPIAEMSLFMDADGCHYYIWGIAELLQLNHFCRNRSSRHLNRPDPDSLMKSN